MYLNVNLTPPQSGGSEGSCTNTPKTPEILNSLISLTTIPSYANYQSQANAVDLLSPASSSASPSEETSATQFGTPTSTSSGAQLSPTNTSDPGGGGGGGTCFLTRVSGAFRGVRTCMAGTPSPPVPELPSPVSTLEATKSALIKEGLKHQIKSKLQAAGMDTNELLLTESKVVKEELSDSRELTPQDEERRMRRRERNKIAATKCRNKKKEKTVHLLSESESVEDQNIRLKSEIQRLTSEKDKLEKLLIDPNHVASCRHSCRNSHQHRQPPLVVITSPDAPEQLLSSSSSAEGTILPISGASPDIIQGGSEQSSEIISNLSFCSPVSSACEQVFTSEPPSSPSYVNLSSSATISPCSLPSVSPPQLTISNTQFPLPPQTTSHSLTSYVSPQTGPPTSFSENANLLALSCSSPSRSTSTVPCLAVPTSESLPPNPNQLESSSNTFLSPKPSRLPTHKRHQSYSVGRPSRVPPYPGDGGNMTPHTPDLQACRDYCYPPITKENAPPITTNSFMYPSQSGTLVTSVNEYASSKNEYVVVGKSRSTLTHCRYNPYDSRSNRHLLNMCSTTSTLDTPYNSIQSVPNPAMGEHYLQTSCNPLTDASQSQFYPPSCTYGNI